jgi:hypothetical protein
MTCVCMRKPGPRLYLSIPRSLAHCQSLKGANARAPKKQKHEKVGWGFKHKNASAPRRHFVVQSRFTLQECSRRISLSRLLAIVALPKLSSCRGYLYPEATDDAKKTPSPV